MKGLLIKDFKLLKMQKNFFLLLLIVALCSLMTGSTFGIGFLTFASALFSISTISYDEFDNGNAFLFSLPISRREYVMEKYCLALLLGLAALLGTTVLAGMVGIVKQGLEWKEVGMSALELLPILFLLLAVLLPFQMKYGGEKARLALIGIFGLIFVIGFLGVKLIETMGIDLLLLLEELPAMSMGMLTLVLNAVGLGILCLSMRVSMRIMEQKEF